MTTVAVLGGGQLGRMLGLAGVPLGLSFRFLDPSDPAPAAAVGDVVVGALDDVARATRATEGATVVTYEWEGVPATTARAVEHRCPVLPPPAALEVAQDRLIEKQRFESLGIATAPFRAVDDEDSLHEAVDVIGLPAVLKTRRGGYDGKGQVVVRDALDVDAAWESLGGQPLVLEAFIDFGRELSIVGVRGRDGTTVFWPVVETRHADGILRVARAPAPRWSEDLQVQAEACLMPLFESLDYVGVACVELFHLDGELLANEMAPRVHNSGHWTIEGAETSQFENHLRAVLGWPLGSTRVREPSVMVNCIGTMPDRAAVLQIPGAHLHDYGKSPRPGRKLGHVTVTAADVATLDARVEQLVAAIR